MDLTEVEEVGQTDQGCSRFRSIREQSDDVVVVAEAAFGAGVVVVVVVETVVAVAVVVEKCSQACSLFPSEHRFDLK